KILLTPRRRQRL
nr:Chain C, Telomere repeats-binding bouquet formation protein 1 [Homo sapiens]5XUP_D Chain D, Telomere repeats-binding bouquet formation protein 1 [Homo sapiens]